MNGSLDDMASPEYAPNDPGAREPEAREPEESDASAAEDVARDDESGAGALEVPAPDQEALAAELDGAADEADLTGSAGKEEPAEPEEPEGPEEPAAETAETAETAEPTEVPAETVEDTPLPDAERVVAEAEAIAEAAAEAPPAEEEVIETTVKDPFKGPGDWYVVHTYAGYENKVKTNLESRIHTMQMEDKIFDVHIPMEDVMEIKSGKKQVVQRKVFPGYLLVRMIYDNDSWYVVRNTPGVTGFVAAGTGTKPTPLSRREVEKILAVKKEEVKPTFRLGFEEGDVVRIISGPFADFNGTINEINVDQSKLKVLVNIFDRETPVELGFDQVAKV